jgi:hypothetical protein
MGDNPVGFHLGLMGVVEDSQIVMVRGKGRQGDAAGAKPASLQDQWAQLDIPSEPWLKWACGPPHFPVCSRWAWCFLVSGALRFVENDEKWGSWSKKGEMEADLVPPESFCPLVVCSEAA